MDSYINKFNGTSSFWNGVNVTTTEGAAAVTAAKAFLTA